jgi:hypothetical protein
MKRLLITLAVLSAAATAPSAMPAPPPLAAHQDGVVGPLLVPGDRVEIRYVVDTPGIKAPTGTLYVRNDLQRSFTSLPLTPKRYHRATVHAVVPASAIHGHMLLYYAVMHDPASGESVTVPVQSAYVLDKPVVVRLGTHRFGRTRASEPVVARAGASQVGWSTEPGAPGGPETFLVGRDRSIWLHDEMNHRLLVFRPGRAGPVARTVTLPFLNGEDVALGPANTVYFTRGLPRPPRLILYRMSIATGKLLWQIRLAGDVGGNTQLRVGPDGTLYALAADLGWMPVATPGGRPLSMAAQRRGAGYQPLPGGLRLLSETYTPNEHQAPREVRCALVDRGGRIVRAWRIVSRTNINLDDLFSTPALVGGDLVVVLQATAGAPPSFKWEYEVLRLGASGTRARFSLPIAAYGEHLFAEIRVGPDGRLYQLASSPATGVRVNRYSLR